MIRINLSNIVGIIPNISNLRGFLTDRCQMYCPPKRDMSKFFVKQVLCGKKALLNKRDVLWVEEVSRYKEISVKRIWKQVQDKPNILKYLPHCKKSLPSKTYLVNVVNTIEPYSMYNLIQKIKRDRQDVKIKSEMYDIRAGI